MSQAIEDKVLISLSFFEPMDLEQILLAIDIEDDPEDRDFTLGDLESVLEKLVREKRVMTRGKGRSKTWVKKYKTRSFWRRLVYMFFYK